MKFARVGSHLFNVEQIAHIERRDTGLDQFVDIDFCNSEDGYRFRKDCDIEGENAYEDAIRLYQWLAKDPTTFNRVPEQRQEITIGSMMRPLKILFDLENKPDKDDQEPTA